MPPSPTHSRNVSSANGTNNTATDAPTQSPTNKRKSSTSTSQEPNGHSKDEADNGKKKRRKVNHACVYCRRSHMTCDLERPCARCVKRDIGHLCHDEPREGSNGRRNGSEVGGMAELAPAGEGEAVGKMEMPGNTVGNGGFGRLSTGDLGMGVGEPSAAGGAAQQPQLAQPTPVSPVQLQRGAAASATLGGMMPPNFDWNNSGVHNQFQDMHHLHPNYMFNTSEVTNEYNLLNDFLSTSLLDDGALYNADTANTFLSDPLLSTNSVNTLANSFPQQPQLQPPYQLPPQQPTLAPSTTQPQNPSQPNDPISRPPSAHPTSEATRNKFYLTAADPAGLSSAEDRLHKLLKAKYDAGMLKPFNYVRGYARLNSYITQHLSRQSQVRILKQLDRFRPKFREAMKNLTDMQLVLVEMWFERSLMEYDRVFASMAIPACCWRRTGEIFRGNREMAELVGVEWEGLRDGRMAIQEFVGEESLVSYWEKFGAIAFDGTQKAILTSCALKRRRKGGEGEEGLETVRCCFSFTIRRDTHNIPSLIVGNFIPIRHRKERHGVAESSRAAA
ncbi:Transcription factor [Saxophila tyrrhenica]|uniref:Transcription factor n=1 Tax=Saxophila tyrrhenica TaxID=1690608 RepID=A0AAV9NX11_9PEZI|nr:Transcription factor [Saxophila tyrrhenica]